MRVVCNRESRQRSLPAGLAPLLACSMRSCGAEGVPGSGRPPSRRAAACTLTGCSGRGGRGGAGRGSTKARAPCPRRRVASCGVRGTRACRWEARCSPAAAAASCQACAPAHVSVSLSPPSLAFSVSSSRTTSSANAQMRLATSDVEERTAGRGECFWAQVGRRAQEPMLAHQAGRHISSDKRPCPRARCAARRPSRPESPSRSLQKGTQGGAAQRSFGCSRGSTASRAAFGPAPCMSAPSLDTSGAPQ